MTATLFDEWFHLCLLYEVSGPGCVMRNCFHCFSGARWEVNLDYLVKTITLKFYFLWHRFTDLTQKTQKITTKKMIKNACSRKSFQINARSYDHCNSMLVPKNATAPRHFTKERRRGAWLYLQAIAFLESLQFVSQFKDFNSNLILLPSASADAGNWINAIASINKMTNFIFVLFTAATMLSRNKLIFSLVQNKNYINRHT